MSLKRYDNYVEFEDLWIDSLPQYWMQKKIKHIFIERSEKGYENEPLLAATQNKGVVTKAVYGNRTVEAVRNLNTLKLVEVGDFVISLRSFQGGIEYAYYRGIISPAYTIMTLDKDYNSEYFKHLFKSKVFIELLKICVTGIREGQNVDYSILKNNKIPVPSRPEQDQIVRLLDLKLSKIDKFVADKKKEIDLLKEYKIAMIDKVVTKGIDDNASMKDSGNDWIGAVPNSWSITTLRHLLHPISIRNCPELQLLSVVREKGIIVRDVNDYEENHNFIPDDLSNYKVVKVGQFAMNKMKAWQGSYGISSYNGLVSPAYYVFDVDIKNKDFFHYAIRSRIYVNFFGKASDGVRIGQWDLSIQRMKDIPFVIPTETEQIEIVEYLKKMELVIFKSIEAIEIEIEKVLEYRTRLISDVVTGKIDVRDIEIPTATEENDNEIN